jgi:hypothetical protein
LMYLLHVLFFNCRTETIIDKHVARTTEFA